MNIAEVMLFRVDHRPMKFVFNFMCIFALCTLISFANWIVLYDGVITGRPFRVFVIATGALAKLSITSLQDGGAKRDLFVNCWAWLTERPSRALVALGAPLGKLCTTDCDSLVFGNDFLTTLLIALSEIFNFVVYLKTDTIFFCFCFDKLVSLNRII